MLKLIILNLIKELKKNKRLRVLAAVFAGVLLATVFLHIAGTFTTQHSQPGSILTINQGCFSQTLDGTLKDYGVDFKTRLSFENAASKTLNLRLLRKDDKYTIVFSSTGILNAFSIVKNEKIYVFTSDGEKIKTEKFDVKVSLKQYIKSGIIDDSLWNSMCEKGVPPSVILDYTDIFSGSVDFLTECRKGDFWAISWDENSTGEGKIVFSEIKAARYNGEESGKNSAGVYKGKYYDEKGLSMRNMFMRAPLRYRRISSFFSKGRYHPILKYVRPHYGIDYSAPTGTPVSAVADGVVTFAARKGANGNLIRIKHLSGYESTYGHLSRFAKSLRKGKKVNQGDVIGYVGSTGLSTGPHLDFRLKQKGKPLNFLKIKRSSSGSVTGKAKEEVIQKINTLPVACEEEKKHD